MLEKRAYTEYKKLCIEKLYSNLNPMQKKAVTTVKGPLLVLAGAGSGKTTVLVNRIYHIINFGDLEDDFFVPENADIILEKMKKAINGTKSELEEVLKAAANQPALPESVLCITFTNKAAEEFKHRLSVMMGDKAKSIWAGTFHSICVRILRKHIGLLGFSNDFTIYDADDSKKLISRILKDNKIDEKYLSAKVVANAISNYKENRIMPSDVEYNNHDMRTKHIAEIYSQYQKALKTANALDFDDIILYTLVLFEEFPEVLNTYRRKFEYILVDEYQDTNPSQNDLVILLGQGKGNVCVVGDDDQSIYSFRGATVENILNFDSSFPRAQVIKLEQNYRSTKTILDAANAVISNNKGRKGKNLWSAGSNGEKITLRSLYTQNEEAEYISGEIIKLKAYGTSLRNIAVLYRVNAISNALEMALRRNGIPYKVFGGTSFLDRKEIKDIVAYLSVILNPSDDIRLRRIINVPKRQIGDATVETLSQIASREGVSMLQIAKNALKYRELARVYPRLEKFYSLIADLRDFAANNSVSALINDVIAKTGYEEELIAEGEKDRVEIVREFASNGVEYENRAENPTLQGFLEEIALYSDTDEYDENSDLVSLMTVHSAKGLEFPVVFIAGFEEGVFPSAMSIQEGNIEEERRLCYVAITRAKEKLYLTHTQSRTLYGFTSASRPSSFLEEIPENLIQTVEKPKARRLDQPAEKPKRKEENPFYTAPKTTPQKSAAFGPGDRVEHKFFGKGTVKSYEAMGSDALIEVEFDNGQTKKLMASFAKLVKI